MRPRYLEIEGLQSFKKKQMVDFDVLGENGLFGIFGATGSGKSTILDAITLALYGSVQRARGTKGIINIDSNELRVCFTFDLLKGSTRNVYRAERTYRRKKGTDNSAECRAARLIEITSGVDTVIADKVWDVNKEVEELLGLNLGDFTRSVVLPQNKFQEFLFLDKPKKRDMMERIFGLEEYGRQLSDRVSKRVYVIRDRISNLEGAISMLGEVSEKLFIQAERRMKSAHKQKVNVQKELKKAEVEFNKTKGIWELVCELNSVEDKLKKHLLSVNEIEIKKNIYRNSAKAEEMMELFHEFRQDEINYKEAVAALESINKCIPDAEVQLNNARKNYDKIYNENEAQKPRFIQKKERLNGALEIWEKLTEDEKELKLKEEKVSELKEQLETFSGTIKRKKDKIYEQEQEFKKYKIEIEGCRVSLNYRNEIQKGSKLSDSLSNALKEKDDLQQRLDEASRRVSKLEKRYKRTVDDRVKIQVSIDNINKEKELFGKSKPWEREDIIREIENNYRQNAVQILAVTLHDGDACPVCGSKSHPRPVSNTNGTNIEGLRERINSISANSNEKLKELEYWEAELDNLNSRLQKENSLLAEMAAAERAAKAELDAHRENLMKIEDLLNKVLERCNLYEEEYNEFLKKHGIDCADREMERIENNQRIVEDRQKELEGLEKQIESGRSELVKLSEGNQQLLNRLAGLEADRRNLEGRRDERRKKFDSLTDGKNVQSELTGIEKRIKLINIQEKEALEKVKKLEKEYNELSIEKTTLKSRESVYGSRLEMQILKVEKALESKGFKSIEDAEKYMLLPKDKEQLRQELENYEKETVELKSQRNVLLKKLDGRNLTADEWEKVHKSYKQKLAEKDECISLYANAQKDYLSIKEKFETWVELDKKYRKYSRKVMMLEQIQKLLKGNSFIEFISEERLRYVAKEASETLGVLTKYRYGLELDSENGFVIRDNSNGGVHRPVTSLSGGEVFLTSLSLALALSKQIQLKGQSPLEFFFLDEGFGSLDSGLLDTVIDSLGRLSSQDRVIGLISHVPELKNRLSKRLIVEHSLHTGRGSCLRVETA